jgi:hypothetical protein
VIEIEEEMIDELIESNIELKKKWYKSIFIYCLKISKDLEEAQKDLS